MPMRGPISFLSAPADRLARRVFDQMGKLRADGFTAVAAAYLVSMGHFGLWPVHVVSGCIAGSLSGDKLVRSNDCFRGRLSGPRASLGGNSRDWQKAEWRLSGRKQMVRFQA